MSDQPHVPPHGESSPNGPLAARKSILIVDDDVEFAEALRPYLEDQGFEVDTASDGMIALGKIVARDYSVIVCDMIMPNMSGDKFYYQTERVRPHLLANFLFITGYHKDPRINAFIEDVSGLVLGKPIPLNVLMEGIRAVLDRQN